MDEKKEPLSTAHSGHSRTNLHRKDTKTITETLVIDIQEYTRHGKGQDSIQTRLRHIKRTRLRHSAGSDDFVQAGGLDSLLQIIAGSNQCETPVFQGLIWSTVADLCALKESAQAKVIQISLRELSHALSRSTNSVVLSPTSRLLGNIITHPLFPSNHGPLFVQSLTRIVTQVGDFTVLQNILRTLRKMISKCNLIGEFIKHRTLQGVMASIKEVDNDNNKEVNLLGLRLLETICSIGIMELMSIVWSSENHHEHFEFILNAIKSPPGGEIFTKGMLILSYCSKHPDGRGAISRAGGIEIFINILSSSFSSLCFDSQNNHQSLASIVELLCHCCRDVHGRQRIRDCGGLGHLVNLLQDCNYRLLHEDILLALICYYFDEQTLRYMVRKLGLMKSLLYHLKLMMTGGKERKDGEEKDLDNESLCNDVDTCNIGDNEHSSMEPNIDHGSSMEPNIDHGSSMEPNIDHGSSMEPNIDHGSSMEPNIDDGSGGDENEPEGDLNFEEGSTYNSDSNFDQGSSSDSNFDQGSSSDSNIDQGSGTGPSNISSPTISNDLYSSLYLSPPHLSSTLTDTHPLSPVALEVLSSSPPPPHFNEFRGHALQVTPPIQPTPINFIDSVISSPLYINPSPPPPSSSSFLFPSLQNQTDNKVLLLLSRISLLQDCQPLLASHDILSVILKYFLYVSDEKGGEKDAFKVLGRIFANPHCFQDCLVGLAPSSIFHYMTKTSQPMYSSFPSLSYAHSPFSQNNNTFSSLPSLSSSLSYLSSTCAYSQHQSNNTFSSLPHPPISPSSLSCPTEAKRQRCSQLLDMLIRVAESPYGQGVIAHMLLRRDWHDVMAGSLSLLLLENSTSICSKMLLQYAGLHNLLLLSQAEPLTVTCTCNNSISSPTHHHTTTTTSTEMASPIIGDSIQTMAIDTLLCLAMRYFNKLLSRKRQRSEMDHKEPLLPNCLISVSSCYYRDHDQRPFNTSIILDNGSVYHVHKEILIEISDVFGIMLSGGFQESSLKKVKLQKISSSTFESLLHHAYGCGFNCSNQVAMTTQQDDNDEMIKEIISVLQEGVSKNSAKHCLDLLIIANQYFIPSLLLSCQKEFETHYLTPFNLIPVFLFSQLHQCTYLSQKCIDLLLSFGSSREQTLVFKSLILSNEYEKFIEMIGNIFVDRTHL